MRKRLLALISAAILALSFAGCDEAVLDELFGEYEETGSTVSASSDSSEALEGKDGPYEVVKVVDGDTLKLMINGEKKNVRLIGIDTPESVHPTEEKNVPEGTLASDHTKELVGDSEVYIEYGTEPQDRYGRPLCYVYLPDGTMLNEKILEDGYAKVLIVGKNKEYKERFYEIQDEAKAEGRGLWPTGVFDDSDASKK